MTPDAHDPLCLCHNCLDAVRGSFRKFAHKSAPADAECENSPSGKHRRAIVGPFCKHCGEEMP